MCSERTFLQVWGLEACQVVCEPLIDRPRPSRSLGWEGGVTKGWRDGGNTNEKIKFTVTKEVCPGLQGWSPRP